MSTFDRLLTPITVEPLALSDVKNYLRVDFTDDDSVITQLLSNARSLAEVITNRALAPQTRQFEYMVPMVPTGDLSGSVDRSPDWYQYEQELGANPFGAAQFVIDVPMSPLQSVSLIETQNTVFDSWDTFTGTWVAKTTPIPGKIYFQSPPLVVAWRVTYVAGYDPTGALAPALPFAMRQALMEAVAYLYQNREAQDFPTALQQKLLSYRTDWI